MQSNSDSRAMNHRLCGLGVLFILLGLVGYGVIQWAAGRIDATAKWPSVTGRIVTSEVDRGMSRTGRTWRYGDIANIRYAYTVNGQRYECEQLRMFPMLHSSDGTPSELVARYPAGTSVTVYYDPANPGDALLTPGVAADARKLKGGPLGFLAPVIGVIGLLMAIIGAGHLWREQRAAQPAAGAADAPQTETPVVQAVLASAPASPVRPRTTHWLLRVAATTLGLFFLLVGSLLTVTTAGRPSPAAHPAAEVIALVIFGGVTLFGGGLVYLGMRKPKPS